MSKDKSINLQTLEKVANALDELNKDVIYVGGAVVALYATDPAADEPRPTEDIDISVKISSYKEMNDLSEKLKAKDIHLDTESDIMYRHKYKDISIDFIPFEDTSIGPTNPWLKPSFEKSQSITIGAENINIPPVSLFLATKWEAYKNRGTDPRWSKDFEDIIYILDNNVNLIQDVKISNKDVKEFLSNMANFILDHSSKDEIIECHLNPILDGDRKYLILQKLSDILEINKKK